MAPLGAMSVFHIAGSDGYIKLSQESSYKGSIVRTPLNEDGGALTYVSLDDLVSAIFTKKPGREVSLARTRK